MKSLNTPVLEDEKIQLLLESVESYYNIENGEGTFLNYQDGNSKELSFWQQIYPSLAYFMLMDRYAPTVDSDAMLRNIADTWYEVVMSLGGVMELLILGIRAMILRRRNHSIMESG